MVGMQIKKKDIISSEMVIVFYYKNCEVTLKKFNDITTIKIVGLSDLGSLLIDSQTFIEKVNKEALVKCLCKNEIENIKKVYNNVVSKEYGNNNNFSFKNI